MVAESIVAGATAGAVGQQVAHALTEDSSTTVALLEQIRDALVTIARYSDIQRYRTIYPRDMSPESTVADGVGRIFRTDSPMRGHHIGFSGGTAGDQFVLRMGTANVLPWVASGGYMDIDLPLLITGGIDLSIRNLTTLDDATWRASLWYELPRDDIAHRMA